MKKLMTAQEASEYIGVKLCTIRRWTHLDIIPYVRIRRAVRYEEEQLEVWLREKRGGGIDPRTRGIAL